MEIKIDKQVLQKCKLMLATPAYGGLLHGAHMQSVIKLQNILTQLGVPFMVNHLYNESLVQRSRVYLTDAFMRSDCTHMLFVDADVQFKAEDVVCLLALQSQKDSPYDVIGAAYPKKCFARTTKILTPDGYVPIYKIVKDNYRGKVMSLSADGVFEWADVEATWKEHNTSNKKWVSIVTSKERPRAVLSVTDDHPIATIDDVMNPDSAVTYTPASEVKGKYMIVHPEHESANRSYYPLFNRDQLAAVVGVAIGDGSVSHTGRMVVVHGPKQVEYNRELAKSLGYVAVPGQHDGTMLSFKNAQTVEIGKVIGTRIKHVRPLLKHMNAISLAYLYMDDGNLCDWHDYNEVEPIVKNTWWVNLNGDTVRSDTSPGEGWKRGRTNSIHEGTCSIATMSVPVDENRELVEWIKSSFGIEAKLMFQSPHKHGEKYPYIYFDREATVKFHQLITPYVLPSMRYKIVKSLRDTDYVGIDSKPLGYGAIMVDDVVSFGTTNPRISKSDLYDITVSGNHNVVANGVVAHNCIAYEKLLAAAKSGAADKDPNLLANYIGDYVFNPIGGQATIPINEPVQVAELGTGFMMIRRETWQKWEKAHQDRLYLPDHVRTKDFDGSREIYLYFDVYVDKQTKRLLSEDYAFCHEVRDIGMQVWMCPWMELVHHGSMAFGGSLAALGSIGAAATADPAKLGSRM